MFGLTPLSALVHKMGRETKEGRRRDKQRKSAKMSNEQVKWGNRCRSKTKKRPSPQVSAPKLQRLKQPSTGVSSGLVNSTVASAILVKWVSMTYAGCFNFDDARVIRAKYSRLVYVLHRVAQGDVICVVKAERACGQSGNTGTQSQPLHSGVHGCCGMGCD